LPASGGKLAEAQRIAASLDHGTVLERMLLYWSGEWEQAEAAWTAAGDRDASAGDRLDGAINAYWAGRVRRLLAAYDPAQTALAVGMLAAAEDRPKEAAEAFAAAAETFRGYACRWDQAEARCLWARALPAEAGSQREIAAGLYRSIGAG